MVVRDTYKSTGDRRQVEDDVSRLQMRIAKATKAQRRNKV